MADIEAVQDTLVRVFQLSGYSWNEGSSESIVPTYPIKFPQMLECLTKCFTSLDLHPNVVTEMIVDLKDELVCGVLKKGYLRKKGHKARNIKRRWFVLTRNDLVYYESRDKMKLKVNISYVPIYVHIYLCTYTCLFIYVYTCAHVPPVFEYTIMWTLCS